MDKKNNFDFSQIDPFMLCMNTTDYNPEYSLSFWINTFLKISNNIIYVILFRNVSNKIIETYNSDNILWIDYVPKSKDLIIEYIRKLSKSDRVIIVGGERLVPYSECRSLSKAIIKNKSMKLHLMESEDWVGFSKIVDCIYRDIQQSITGLVFICNVNKSTSKIILKELESSENMSISENESINASNGESLREMVNNINKLPIDEALKLIENYKEAIGECNLNIYKAIAYFNNNNLTHAKELLSSSYEYLTNEMKCFLADLYNVIGDNENAKKIIDEIYTQDRMQRGLFELALRVYNESDEKYKEFVEMGIKYDPENPAVIEGYASWLSYNGRYKEAAACFRKLYGNYYELVARINDLLSEGQTDFRIVEGYIYPIIEKEPELFNEAMLRMGNYCFKNGSMYGAYHFFLNADISTEKCRSYDILINKIDILKDTKKASRALGKRKPYKKQEDAILIANERGRVLVQAIQLFAFKKHGYSHWRELLECQQYETWINYVIKYLISELNNLCKIDINNYLNKSYINKLKLSNEELNAQSTIYSIRKSNSGVFPHEKLGLTRYDLEKGALTWGEMYGTNRDKIWIRYYISIGDSLLSSNPQDANNHSLMLNEYVEVLEGDDKKLCAYLFLLSWGNAQYRLGNEIEGLICICVGIKMAIDVCEITPILEDGLNIIFKFICNNKESFSIQEEETISSLLDQLKIYNNTIQTSLLFSSGNTNTIINNLITKVKTKEKNANWMIDLANLIQFTFKDGKKAEAVDLIKKNYKYVKELLNLRKDIAGDMLYSWADMIFRGEPSVENLKYAILLLNDSMSILEERRSVSHQDERSGLANSIDRVIRKKLEICGILWGCNDLHQDIKDFLYSEIIESFKKCIPLSVIEQKRYNYNKNISSEDREKDFRLQILKEEYIRISQNNYVNQEQIKKLVEEIEILTNELVDTHPYYKPLIKYGGTKWNVLQEIMDDNDAVYQYIITPICVLSVFANKKEIEINSIILDGKNSNAVNIMKEYQKIMEMYSYNDKVVDNNSEAMTNLVAEQLCKKVWEKKYKRIFVIPDVKYSSFPLAASIYKGEYLIDKINDIVHFIDYEAVIRYIKREEIDYKIYNKLFGNHQDKSIAYIKKWLIKKQSNSFFVDTNYDDSIKDIIEFCNNNCFNTFIIYGHGVSDPVSSQIDGAQTILGTRRMINIENLVDGLDADNIIIISCMTGVPNGKIPDKSTGTWAQMFQGKSGNIIMCKWSVDTKETINLLDYMLDVMSKERCSIGKALNKAQKEFSKSKNLFYWSGIEFWVN